MVDREVGREMGMELLECLFETQVQRFCGEYPHKFIFHHKCSCTYEIVYSLANFSDLKNFAVGFPFPASCRKRFQHIAIMIIMINVALIAPTLLIAAIHIATPRLSLYLEISWLLIRSHSVCNYYVLFAYSIAIIEIVQSSRWRPKLQKKRRKQTTTRSCRRTLQTLKLPAGLRLNITSLHSTYHWRLSFFSPTHTYNLIDLESNKEG